jgi:two-component system OmpR family response regulator
LDNLISRVTSASCKINFQNEMLSHDKEPRRTGLRASNGSGSGQVQCLVIEDEVDTAQYICAGLEEAGFTAIWCRDGVDGLRLAVSKSWDVVILDRMLPRVTDGLSIIRSIRDVGKTTPVLILSAMASLDERVRGLRSGGDDYLTKPFAFSELLARVHALLRRSAMREDVSELRVADLKLDLRKRKAERATKPIELQPREFRLLEYLVRHQGQVVTRTMLLESVWDYHFDPQTNVIDVQISRLRQKIDKEFSPPLLHTVRGVGYMFGVNE